MSDDAVGNVTAVVQAVLLDYNGAARALGISVRSLSDLVKNSQIPVVRIGARVLFRPSALAACAAEQER